MAETDKAIRDYSTGAPRHHHSLYIEDGNLVLQVENAIFKVHGSFLAKQSSVIKGMLQAPQPDTTQDGTDEKPLVLRGDTAAGWELLLESLYESTPFDDTGACKAEQMLSVLTIAHKYCMDKIETAILWQLQRASTTAGYVDLLVAAQIIGSNDLYQKVINILRKTPTILDLEQSERIGAAATYYILTATISALSSSKDAALKKAKLAAIDNTRCRHCRGISNWKCRRPNCGEYQLET